MVLPTRNPTKSYWIEAAESPLRDYRSTADLPTEADVVIIGSRYTGSTAAYWIHKYTEHYEKRPRIVMLDAGEICGRATGRNGGQLRPHLYSRYPLWSERFGSGVAMDLIRHEIAHLAAFKDLADEEGIAEEVCLKFGETFDAAMTQEALNRLFGALEKMTDDQGADDPIVNVCRRIDDPKEAEEFSQMKGAMGVIVHPTGQIWPYKFVHALLRIVLDAGLLNLQAHTPVHSVSERDIDGTLTVQTDRGNIRCRSVLHATNAYASYLLPELTTCIMGTRSTLAAIKAPEGFIKRTGAQHWDAVVNNYHLQLPPPYNAIILGGARQVTVHDPDACFLNGEDNKQIEGVAEFCRSWPTRDVAGWPENLPSELALKADEGGCWTGIESTSSDSFPFVGPVPKKAGHFIAAGFHGHGMPRILLSTAHIVSLVLASIGQEYTPPKLVEKFPALPQPFCITDERVERVARTTNLAAVAQAHREKCRESAKKESCKVWK